MKVFFLWTGFTSYMADCWRRLAAEPDVELRVWIEEKRQSGTAFDPSSVMRGINYAWKYSDEITPEVQRQLESEILDFSPDVLFVVGWARTMPPFIVKSAKLKSIPKVCCFDMPWRWKLRCLVAPLILGRFLRNYQAAFVPGSVCARYAKWLGFSKIYPGLFAIDTAKFAPPSSRPTFSAYFLYVGRNTPEKRLSDIRKAHALYRERGGKLELRMYGKDLENGFANPQEVPALMHGAAAFVLASDFDPWPLVLLEAMSAGCPVIASDKCTNRPELGKNWRVFKTGDVEDLAKAMEDFDRVEVERCGKENFELARQYDCGEWVKRVRMIVKELTK